MTNVVLNGKKDLAERFQVSTRLIGLMVNDGRLPKLFYLGDSSPRRRQSDIDSWLGNLATEAQSEVVSE